jgi:hypothetical protein
LERDVPTDASKAADLPLDTLYKILSNRRRRLVLHYLVNAQDHEAVLGSLATQVAAWENDIPVSAVDSTLRKRAYNTLQQTHLPKMDDAGVIDYNRNRGTITLTSYPGQLALFLNVLPRAPSTWTKGFILAGFVLWSVLVANWFSVHVFQFYRPGSAAVLSAMTLFLVFAGFIHVYILFRPSAPDSLP